MSCLVPTCVLHFAWFSCIEAPTARNDQEMVATHPLGLPFSWRLQSIKLQLIHFSSNEMQLYYINLYNCINCIVVSTGVAVSHGRRWQPTRPTWIWPCLQQRKGGDCLLTRRLKTCALQDCFILLPINSIVLTDGVLLNLGDVSRNKALMSQEDRLLRRQFSWQIRRHGGCLSPTLETLMVTVVHMSENGVYIVIATKFTREYEDI